MEDLLTEFLSQVGTVENILKFLTALLGFLVAFEKLREAKTEKQSGATRGKLFRLGRYALIGMLFVVAIAAAVLLVWRPSRTGLARVLERGDPSVFYQTSPGKSDGRYDIARALPDRRRLLSDTSVVAEWNGTQRTLDFMAIGGTVLVNQWTTVEDLLKRHVSIRIILLDPSSNPTLYDEIITRAGEDPERARKTVLGTIAQLEGLVSRSPPASARFPGTIRIRQLPPPMFYTCWVRDSGWPTSLVHVQPLFYTQNGGGPSFRLGSAYGGDTATLVAQDFERAWELSKPLGHLPH